MPGRNIGKFSLDHGVAPADKLKPEPQNWQSDVDCWIPTIARPTDALIVRDFRTSDSLRDVSKAAFNSRFRIEIALAILELESTFTFEDLYAVVHDVAVHSDVEPPSHSNVRTEIARMRDVYGALSRLPRPRGEQIRREVRQESALWALCQDIYRRAHPS